MGVSGTGKTIVRGLLVKGISKKIKCNDEWRGLNGKMSICIRFGWDFA